MKSTSNRKQGSSRAGGLLAGLAAAAGAVALVRLLQPRKSRRLPSQARVSHGNHYHTVVIGSGFGGSMTGLTIARAMAQRGAGEKLLMLERGTWWTTPLNTVEDKEGAIARHLKEAGQPVQYWNSIDHLSGLFDLALRCVRRPGNEDGLYAQVTFGRSGAIGLAENDGVSIVGGNGVGGGSLVYSNVTIAPPDFVLDDPAWPMHWNGQREFWFDLARDAIGSGVLYAWARRAAGGASSDLNRLRSSSGLSNLATRTAGLDPHWPRDASSRPIKHLDLTSPLPADAPDPSHGFWIDRARVFQTAMSHITADFGTVDSAINDLPSGPEAFNADGNPADYCERQGRCILGCLANARQTLSKQLMAASLGWPALLNQPARPPLLPCMSVQTLAEVDVIQARPGGGYEIHYLQRDPGRPEEAVPHMVTADVVILAAGCTSTNEILLRSKASGGLPCLSDTLGFGFSTNGDSLWFLDKTRERTYLTRGPMMTSVGRFHTAVSGDGVDPQRFHAIEDNGIPKVFAMLVGMGQPLVRSIAKGHVQNSKSFLARMTGLWFLRKFLPQVMRTFAPGANQHKASFRSEDELLANMLCVATMGRDQANGRFRLGDPAQGDTPLRLARADGKEFYQDPIYHEIRHTLNRFAETLTGRKGARFENPFFDLGRGKGAQLAPVPLTHPLGGCRMAANAAEGVVDEFGRVFDTSQTGAEPFYQGLYVTDASIMPTSLGVNPTLTIAAVALRAAEKIVQERYPVSAGEKIESREPRTENGEP